MKLHFLYKDGMGVVTLFLVYGSMLLGQALFIYSVAWPTFTGERTDAGRIVGVVFELLLFEALWFMMLWSHTATMCIEPGYIPKSYSYSQERLPNTFRSFF